MRRGLVPAAFIAGVGTCFAGAAYASAGHTDVTISTAPTHNMVLNNGVYSPTGDGAVLNVSDLTNALNAGNLEVTTGTTQGAHPSNIAIEAAFHWVSANALTFDAYRSISVDQPVTDAGPGALTLTTNDGGTNGHLEFSARGNINFWGLANALTINGKAYTLVNSVASLASSIANAAGGGNYALAASYDAAVDHTYKRDPIELTFLGNFEGLGNSISNVSILFSPPSGGNVGFFDTIGAGASVSNFRLRDIKVLEPPENGGNDITYVGALAGESLGSLFGDDVSGRVTVRFYGHGFAGGLIGTGEGSIDRCSSSANVGLFDGSNGVVGGLAGVFSGVIADSSARAG